MRDEKLQALSGSLPFGHGGFPVKNLTRRRLPPGTQTMPAPRYFPPLPDFPVAVSPFNNDFSCWRRRSYSVHFPGGRTSDRRLAVLWHRTGPMDFRTLVALATMWLFVYSAWLTSIVFCASNGERRLLIAGASFFPIGVVHGIGVWFGGW
jgi:hypothetical protein